MKSLKYLLIAILALSGCTLDRQTRTNTKVHLFNPFYRPGGNPTYVPAQRYTSVTDRNMPKEWR